MQIRGYKESEIIFSTFSHDFSFSYKLIKHFLKIVGDSLVIMHPNVHSKPQLPIAGCFGYSEVHLFQFQKAGRG